MNLLRSDSARDSHPVDVIEQVALTHEWSFEREADDEIAISVAGVWGNYEVSFSWMDVFEALHVACAFDMKVPEQRVAEVTRLLAQINEQLLFGHFDLWHREGTIMFRQTLMLPGGLEPTALQIQTMLKSSLEACECYFQSFQYVTWAGMTAEKAIEQSIFETWGTA